MRRALRLAERGRGRTRPNPIVGAVLVRDGRVVGEGWHAAAGAEHAEVVALERAGSRARGATLYVTLEPCAHTGRTPPCVDALIAAGVEQCVVAMRDPHRIVNGRGLRRLRGAGLGVHVGMLEAQAREALAGYVEAHTEGVPRVTLKLGVTLDGKIADARGHSRWITGPASRARAHQMRAAADAILIGSGTARADDPALTARLPGLRRQPLRIVCDTRLRLPLTLRLLRAPLAHGTVVACGARAPLARRRALERRGVTVWPLPTRGGHVSPRALARRLAVEGCHEVLLEGGATLGTAWLREGLVRRVALFVAPRILGGDALAWCGPLGLSLEGAPRARRVTQTRIGDEMLWIAEWGR